MRRTIGGFAAIVVALTTAACDSETKETKDEPRSVERVQTPVKADWTLDLDVVSQPRVADGVALTLVRDGGGLEAVAVDAATGERLWSAPWSPGDVPPGYTLEPAVFETSDGRAVTAFSVPPKDLAATSPDMWVLPVTVRDLRTGKQLHRTEPLDLSTPLIPCADGKDACFTERPDGGRRLDLATGRVGKDSEGAPSRARSIGDGGIFSTNDRPGEQVGVVRDGEVVWSKPVDEVMGAPVTTDTGWEIDHDADADRYVALMVRFDPVQLKRARSGRPYTIDADTAYLAGIDGASGRNLWTERGAVQDCLGIETDAPRVRCKEKGVRVFDASGTAQRVDDAAVTVEGFDPADGSTTWSVEVAPAAAEDVVLDRNQPIAKADTALVATADGPRVVDLRTGEQSAAAADDVFTCAGTAERVTYRMKYFIDGRPVTKRSGEARYRPCTPGGGEAKSFTAPAIRDAGEPAGKGRYVLATGDGLQGFTAPR